MTIHELKNKIPFPGWSAMLAVLVLIAACSKDSTSPESGDRVINSMPLELGNRWEYALEQSIYVVKDDQSIVAKSSSGRQIITVNRTENIDGSEAFGLTFDHLIGYLFSEGADTVIERRYLAPQSDGRVLLKAEESVYNPTGGFIPFSQGDTQPRYGTMLNIGGKERFISLETLGYLLADPRGSYFSDKAGTALASDGIQSNEDAYIYEVDYIYVYDELYDGLRWVSIPSTGVGGIEVSNRVTSILGELDGYDGPIAEVEQTNSLYSALGSENYKQRFYFKGNVGLVRAEISDPEFFIYATYPDSLVYVGIGTWTFTKKLSTYNLK